MAGRKKESKIATDIQLTWAQVSELFCALPIRRFENLGCNVVRLTLQEWSSLEYSYIAGTERTIEIEAARSPTSRPI